MRRIVELVSAAGVAAAITIVYLTYVGRVVGPSEYAAFSTALSFLYLVAVACSPLAPAIARMVARRAARGDDAAVAALRRGFLRPLALALITAAVLLIYPAFALTRALKFDSPAPLMLAFASALAFTYLSADRGFLQGSFRFREYSSSILIESVLRLGVAVLALHLLGRSAAVALISYLTGIVVAETFIAWKLRGGDGGRAGRAEWDELRRLLVPLVALMAVAALHQNTDMIAVKRWFPDVEAGRYGAATALAKLFGAVFVPFYVLVVPVLTRHHERGEALVRPALHVAGQFATLSAVALFGFAFGGEFIMRLLFGSAFVPGAWLAVHLGTVSVLLHTSLLLVQVFITLNDFGFLKFFGLSAVVQVAGLLLFHATFFEILATLYAAQIVLIVPLALRLFLYARTS